ncbi:MAG: hypothetical protein IPG66_01330 [Hydrogenophilales bacterium]|nr:hypothetical protein [Hydrogenophilales bacterium]
MIQFFEAADEDNCRPLPGSRTFTVAGVLLCAALYRKALFDELGGFCNDMRFGEDIDLFLRMIEARVPVHVEDEIATLYRRHAGNMTNDLVMTRRGFADAIRRSVARRRVTGATVDLGSFFQARNKGEHRFQHG